MILHLSTLNKTNSSYVCDEHLHARENNTVRLLTHIGLLYQNLIHTHQLLGNGKLPPVFPIVLYNGKQPWSSATALERLTQQVSEERSQYRSTFNHLR